MKVQIKELVGQVVESGNAFYESLDSDGIIYRDFMSEETDLEAERETLSGFMTSLSELRDQID